MEAAQALSVARSITTPGVRFAGAAHPAEIGPALGGGPTATGKPEAVTLIEPEFRRRIDALGDEIATLAAHMTAAEYRLLCAIREFDACDGWYHHGARSCAHWLNWRIGLGLVAAREKVRVARALAELPRLSAAMERGALSYSKVRALTRIATAENERDLLENASFGTASHVEKMVRLYRQACRPDELRRAAEQQAEKYLRVYWDDCGMLVIEGRLPPEEGALVRQVLETARRELVPSELVSSDSDAHASAESFSSTPSDPAPSDSAASDSAESFSSTPSDPAPSDSAASDSAESSTASLGSGLLREPGVQNPPSRRPRVDWSRQMADALVSLAYRCATSHDATNRDATSHDATNRDATSHDATSHDASRATDPSRGPRPQVIVHVDLEALADVNADGRCEIEGGPVIAGDTMRRLACDANLATILHGKDGEPLGVGRKTRKVSSRLRRALWNRDRGCTFPGCTCERFLQAHHVQHWADGGVTEPANLLLLCTHHHRLMHEGGFSVRVDGGAIRFFDPWGRPVPSEPNVPTIDGDPLLLLHREHVASIDAWTTMPDWDGEQPDYEEMLRPLFETRM